jgi:hypothetical protein
MKHLLEYKSYLNESDEYNKGVMIIDYLKNSEDGKFLQLLISNGTLRDFDSLFKLVRTGRVYIKGSYAGNTKFYTDGDRWCQISESSGNTYGQACFNTIEELVKYSATRYVLIRRERGLNEDDLERWIRSNWTDVVKKLNAKEVLDAYKESKGLSSMITDYSNIGNLPIVNEYRGIFFPQNLQHFGTVPLNVDPFNIYYTEEDYISVNMNVKLTNKQGYSSKEELSRNRTEISMGTSDVDQLDQYVRKGLIYTLSKKYDNLIKREYARNPVKREYTDILVAAKELYLGMLTQGNKGQENNMLLSLRKIKDKNPLALGKVLRELVKYNPEAVDKFEEEFGKEETEALTKGSSILNRLGI